VTVNQVTGTKLPLPPDNLAKRAGGTAGEQFDAQGREIQQYILRSLPENYDFTNKRVLDFGCGAGRVLRHFQREAEKGEFWGCDIHYQSIAWVSEHLSNFHVFQNKEIPQLPVESNYFDLIYVISVFTHLTSTWKSWLGELRRVLKPGGILVITFHNRVAYEYTAGRHFDEKSTGMLIMDQDRPWNEGGPIVYHSNWWILKHWGEFFNVEFVSREALFGWQSLAVLSKSDAPAQLKENSMYPILQPHAYQFYDPSFRGNLNIPNRRSNYLKHWHGMEFETSKDGKGSISGWFISKIGMIKEIKILIDCCEVATLPGANGIRKNVEPTFPDWQHGLSSGFEVTLDLSRYSIGEHDLRVVATDDAGRQHELQSPLLIAGHRESETGEMAPAPRLQDVWEVVNCKSRGEIAAPVTVTISLYNYRDDIIPCLESVKSQTLRALDLIVVDDCSTDDSLSVVTDWISKNESRFKDALLIRHKSNRGLPFARNSAFAHARTEFVFVLDADNLLYPRCLERLLVALSQCEASFAYCLLEKFGEVIGIGNTRQWDPIALQYGNFIDAMVLHRKSLWESAAGYAIDMPAMGWEDFDLWFRIARAGGWGVQVPEILARYRVRRSSMLHTITNPCAEKLWAYLRGKYPEFFVA